MEKKFENLNNFFDKIKAIGFFQRLFFWKQIVNISYDAYEEFKSINNELERINGQLKTKISNNELTKKDLENQKEILRKEEIESDKLKNMIEVKNKEISDKENKIGKLKESNNKNENRIIDLEKDLNILKIRYDELIKKNNDVEKEITVLKKTEQKKQEEYEHNVTELNSLKKQLDDDRIRIQDARESEIKEKFEQIKQTWINHEINVERKIKEICKRNQIEYIDKEKVPFKGKPDNTITIAGEHVIFDAKSPKSDDLKNFSVYIKNQTETIKKYAVQEGIKKELFLVVPSNTVEVINNYYYNMADYNVYIVTESSLEPIILSLKKIEEYEFAEQLSPEDRENICRIIGKFAHATKRRIQIDNYFSKEFVNILTQCNVLPLDMQNKSIEFEKSDKFNPPQEKRAKKISSDELKKETKHVKQEAELNKINMTNKLEKIEEIPLYKER